MTTQLHTLQKNVESLLGNTPYYSLDINVGTYKSATVNRTRLIVAICFQKPVKNNNFEYIEAESLKLDFTEVYESIKTQILRYQLDHKPSPTLHNSLGQRKTVPSCP